LTTGSGSLRANSRTVFAAWACGGFVLWATGGTEGAGSAGGVALKCSESRLVCRGVAASINCSTDGREKAGEGRGAVGVTGETCGEPGALVRAGAETSLEKSSNEEAQIAGLGATGAGAMAGEAGVPACVEEIFGVSGAATGGTTELWGVEFVEASDCAVASSGFTAGYGGRAIVGFTGAMKVGTVATGFGAAARAAARRTLISLEKSRSEEVQVAGLGASGTGGTAGEAGTAPACVGETFGAGGAATGGTTELGEAKCAEPRNCRVAGSASTTGSGSGATVGLSGEPKVQTGAMGFGAAALAAAGGTGGSVSRFAGAIGGAPTDAGGATAVGKSQKPAAGSENWSSTKPLAEPPGADFTTWQTTPFSVLSLKRKISWPGTSGTASRTTAP